MYKCLVIDDNADASKTIDDSEYIYPQLTREEKLANTTGTCYLFKKIKYIDDNRLCLANLKEKGIVNDLKIQSSIKSMGNEKLFNYLDKIFDEDLGLEADMQVDLNANMKADMKVDIKSDIEADFMKIIKESDEISSKYRDEYIKIRIGQSKFREALIEKHGCKCAICGLNIKELLIASHIKEYSKCEKNEHLDLKNGLLLCANHDKLFDKHLISFLSNGQIIICPNVERYNCIKLNMNERIPIYKDSFKEEFMKLNRE